MLDTVINSIPQIIVAVTPASARFLLKDRIHGWLFSGTHLSLENDVTNSMKSARTQVIFNIEYIALLGVSAIGLLTFIVHAITTEGNGNPLGFLVAGKMNPRSIQRAMWLVLGLLFLAHFLVLLSRQTGGWSDFHRTTTRQRWYFKLMPIVILCADKMIKFLIEGIP